MRVAWHMPTLRQYSCGLSLRALKFAGSLRDAGHEVSFFVEFGKTDEGERLDGFQIEKISVAELSVPHWSLQSLERRRRATRLVRMIYEPHDIFVSCQPEALSAYARSNNGVPSIFVCGGSTLLHEQNEPTEKTQSLRLRASYKLDRRLKRNAERHAMQSAAAVVLNSNTTRDRVLAEYDLDGVKLNVILGGVDVSRFRPPNVQERALSRERFGLNCNAFVMSWCGRMSTEKNLLVLIECAAMLNQSNLRLLLVGDGPERSAIEEAVRQAGLASCVIMAGEQDDVQPALWASDAFVFPSRGESFGNALAEAMACGLSCIGTRSDGIGIRNANEEILDDGRAGLLTESPDASGLAAAVRALMTDPAVRRQLGDSGRRRAEEHFSWSKAGQRFTRLVERVAGMRRCRNSFENKSSRLTFAVGSQGV